MQGSSRVDFCLKSCHQHTEEVLAVLEQFRSRLRLYVIKQSSAIPLSWFLICCYVEITDVKMVHTYYSGSETFLNGSKDISASSKDKFHAGVSY